MKDEFKSFAIRQDEKNNKNLLEKEIRNLAHSIIFAAFIVLLGLWLHGNMTSEKSLYAFEVHQSGLPYRFNCQTGETDVYFVNKPQNEKGWIRLESGPIDMQKWYEDLNKKIENPEILLEK